jgi:hypothetical protein
MHRTPAHRHRHFASLGGGGDVRKYRCPARTCVCADIQAQQPDDNLHYQVLLASHRRCLHEGVHLQEKEGEVVSPGTSGVIISCQLPQG